MPYLVLYAYETTRSAPSKPGTDYSIVDHRRAVLTLRKVHPPLRNNTIHIVDAVYSTLLGFSSLVAIKLCVPILLLGSVLKVVL